MRTVRLGRTGLEVSRISLGGIPLTRPTPAEAERLLRVALDLGFNLIDTAIGYKDSEERIGRGIRGRRDQVIIATKTPARDGPTAIEHLEASLARLGTDYIDIWQLHGVTPAVEYEKVRAPGGALEAAEAARRAGKVRYIGLTSHSLETAIRATESGLFDTIQYQLNFISPEAADRLVGLAREHGVGYLAMKPFAGGMIRDAGLAMRYLLQFENVVPIPGFEKEAELLELAALAEDDRPLEPAELAATERLRAETGSRFCRQCEYCLPCPNQVLIPGVLYLTRLWALWPAEYMRAWRYPLAAAASFDNCSQCGECEAKCPYGLPIREMMDENLAFHRRSMDVAAAYGGLVEER